MSALYIHIPFCKKRCNYCDFYKECGGTKEELEKYIVAAEKEMEYRRDFLAGDPVRSIFFGGGTPSLYAPEKLQQLIDKARSLWDLSDLREVTIEANPDDITEEYLEALAKTDVNRLSFGVQSFVDRDLELLGRRHNAEQAYNAIKLAREKGFNNISIDLIYGIPGQSTREWDTNLMRAIVSGVDHVSAYHLSIEPGTKFYEMVAAEELSPVDEASSEMQYALVNKFFAQAGFDHYEISNYARTPEMRSLHNYSYWSGERYLGIGPSAHSYDGDTRIFVVSSLDKYLAGVGTDAIYTYEKLNETERYNEYLMVSLRTFEGIRRDTMTNKFGVETLLAFEYDAEKFVRNGLLMREDNRYYIPSDKFFVSDSIIRDLFRDDDE